MVSHGKKDMCQMQLENVISTLDPMIYQPDNKCIEVSDLYTNVISYFGVEGPYEKMNVRQFYLPIFSLQSR